MNAPAFDLLDVAYAYRESPALAGVTLTIPAGRRVALLGANGSGKSTLLRLLDALYFPEGGRIEAFGETLSEAAMGDEGFSFEFRRRVGLVFQNPDVQLFNPTVFDELAFGPLQLGWEKPRIRQAVAEFMERFAIADLKDRPPHRLSGGEKKRVALASVMVVEPEVLLLDEPTAALDPQSRSEIVRFLAEEQGCGRTIVTATHDLDIVEDIADEVVVLDGGRVAAQGCPAKILADVELLRRTHLLHSHWHRHADGTVHAHHHLHR